MADQAFSILLVDDSDINQEVWRSVLEDAGYRVLSALDGQSALNLVDTEDVDLVLLDIVMPGMTGLQVLETMRERHDSRQLPVIMATAKDQSDDVVKAFNLGANDYVTKPLDTRITLARIRAQLRSRGPRSDESTSSGEIGPGVTLRGRYRLDTLIGKGNFGSVYKATHLGLQRAVAVKILRAGFGDETSLARFRQEGISLSRLQHTNAVAVLDFDVTDKDIAFLVMELLRGRSLEALLENEGPLSPVRAAQIILPVCDVLTEAHALGIIHRDIKPHNVFLHHGRRGELVKVLDFGIAKLVGETEIAQRLTVEGSSIGTPAYMAPERFTNEPYDGKADVYSLAVTLYEMLTGRTPFHHADGNFFKLIRMHVVERPGPLRAYVPNLPRALEELVLRALSKQPEQRPTAAELALELTRILELEPAPQSASLDDSYLELRAAFAGKQQGEAREPRPLQPTVEWRDD
ncbi:MAG: protein kinase [Acidobacteriota bacterium]